MNKSKELNKLQENCDNFEKQCKDLTLDRMNEAPVAEMEPQTKLSSKEIDKSKEIYLKPERHISDPVKFNEAYREDWNFAKEYVNFVAEHKELIGEMIEMWCRPFAGVGATYWKIPTNKPVWAPRYVAEQIRRRRYHRLRMDENRMHSQDGTATYYGSMVADTTIPRLTAEPVSSKKSVFMGAAA
jgi:hypothetical protein